MADGRMDAAAGSEKDTNDIAKTGLLGYVIQHAQDIEYKRECICRSWRRGWRATSKQCLFPAD